MRAAVVALETALTRVSKWNQTMTAEELAKTSSRYTLNDLARRFPEFDWRAWAKPQGIDRAGAIILSEPSFFQAFAAMVPRTPLPVWRAWLAARYITALAPYLSRPFSDARFDFFGRVLSGQETIRVAWKRGVALVNSFLGDAIGQRYVERHLSPRARTHAERVVATVFDAYRRAIRHLDWMSAATRQVRARRSSIPHVGPGRLPRRVAPLRRTRRQASTTSSATCSVRAPSTIDARMARVRDDSGHDEWLITPQTVNAYYNPVLNQIVRPAAMLQPAALHRRRRRRRMNHGAIGAVIGHEIGHAFDGLGRELRCTERNHARGTGGRPRTIMSSDSARSHWWGQFNTYAPLARLARERRAHARRKHPGDASAACRSPIRRTHLSLAGHAAPVLDGFTGDQRFFLSWARIAGGRNAYRDEYLRQTLLAQPYAPE